jgi:hypothetical protein
MHPTDIAHRRLHNQRLAGNPLASPEAVVGWLGAVQAQDYGPAKWSLGERSTGALDADVDRALAAGAIVRTHLLRPTWHFVLPADIRWMQALTAPRVHALNAYYYRQTGLEDGRRQPARRLIVDALRGGNRLTRGELEKVLAGGGITVKGIATAYVLMDAELDCVVTSGGLRGRQQTYALFDERVPATPPLSRDEALERLAVRYFASRGPATARDLRFWSSLPLADLQRGIEIAGARLVREEIEGRAFWSAPGEPPPPMYSPSAHLLQGLDEYFVGYGESRGFCSRESVREWGVDRAIFNGAVVVDTQLAGHWKRTVGKRAVAFQLALHAPADAGRTAALRAAADAQAAFLGLPAELEIART